MSPRLNQRQHRFRIRSQRTLDVLVILLTVNLVCAIDPAVAQAVTVKQWGVFEKAVTSTQPYSDEAKYKDVILNATFIGPRGLSYTVPGFWDGDKVWRIRFSPTTPGEWRYRIDSTDDQLDAPANDGTFVAEPPTAADISGNQNYRGFLKVSRNRRYLEYGDGTPFFWLGDTVWDGNSKNMGIDTDFPFYIENRKDKGFSVIQILVAHPGQRLVQLELQGCKPPRNTGCNESGYVYEMPSNFSRISARIQRTVTGSAPAYPEAINPENFQNLDRRLQLIVDHGMVPYIVFGWAKDFGAVSTESLKSYVRYIIARYQAYNVIWCISGEHYFLKDKAKFKAIGDYVKDLDALGHLTTIHGWTPGELDQEPWLDFISLTAWGLPRELHAILAEKLGNSRVPFLLSESRYDGNEPGPAYAPRKYALEALTAGAMGYTYGADGVWDWGTDARFPNPRSRLDIPSSLEMQALGRFLSGIEWWKLSYGRQNADRDRVLSEPGKQYLVWLEGGGPVTLPLPKGQVRVTAKWLNLVRRTVTRSDGITSGGKQTFTPPEPGDTLLYLTLRSVSSR